MIPLGIALKNLPPRLSGSDRSFRFIVNGVYEGSGGAKVVVSDSASDSIFSLQVGDHMGGFVLSEIASSQLTLQQGDQKKVVRLGDTIEVPGPIEYGPGRVVSGLFVPYSDHDKDAI